MKSFPLPPGRPARRPTAPALALPFTLLSIVLLSHCGEWVSLGPFVECGRPCALPEGAKCDAPRTEYNRFGECVCGEVWNCPGFVCRVDEPSCFIAQYDQNGECACTVWISEGTCGQPCKPSPEAALQNCPGNRWEYDGIGRCACGPAVCPCGQPCRIRPGEDTDCHVLHQYDENGFCVCGPVYCKAYCKDNPCCGKPCGAPCPLSDCEGAVAACTGQCNEKSQCVLPMATDCEEPPK